MATVATVWWTAFAVMNAILAVYRYVVPEPESPVALSFVVMSLVPGTATCGVVAFGLSQGHRWAWVISAATLGFSGSYYVSLALSALVRVLQVDQGLQLLGVALKVTVALPIVLAAVTLSSGAASRWFAEPTSSATRVGTPQWLVISAGVWMVVVIVSTALQLVGERRYFSPARETEASVFSVQAVGIGLGIVALMALVQLVSRRPNGQFGVMAMCAALGVYPYTSAIVIGYSPSLQPPSLIVPAFGFILAASLDLRPSVPNAPQTPHYPGSTTAPHLITSRPPHHMNY